MRKLAITALLTSVLASACITTPNFYVEKNGEGQGVITSDTGDVDCGEDCGGLIEGPITLTATPGFASVFGGWSGTDSCGAEPTCTLEVNEDTRISARFDIGTNLLTVTPVEHGVIHAHGIDCGTDCTETFRYDAFVTITVTTDREWEVVGWEGANCTGQSCILRMTESFIVKPILALRKVTLSMRNVSPYAVEPVTSSPAGISCGYQCSAQFEVGTTVTLTASSANVSWSGCVVDPMLPGQCSLKLIADQQSVTATYN